MSSNYDHALLRLFAGLRQSDRRHGHVRPRLLVGGRNQFPADCLQLHGCPGAAALCLDGPRQLEARGACAGEASEGMHLDAARTGRVGAGDSLSQRTVARLLGRSRCGHLPGDGEDSRGPVVRADARAGGQGPHRSVSTLGRGRRAAPRERLRREPVRLQLGHCHRRQNRLRRTPGRQPHD